MSRALAVVACTALAAAAAAQSPDGAQAGAPVNLYAPGAADRAAREDGEIHPWHVGGKVWLMAGQPGESNVAVHLGDEGVLVVDTGARAMASKLLARIQELAQQRGGLHKEVRLIVNTNGQADHLGGNELIRENGSRVVAGEAAAQQNAFGAPGAAIYAHRNVLDRLVAEASAAGTVATSQKSWPSDVEDQEVYSLYVNGESVQLHHPRNSSSDGQLVVVIRESNVIVAGDVLDMTSYPAIDVARGGTIDGELVALNKLIDMTVSQDQVEGGTVVIPGHGRLCDLGDIARYTVMITTIRNRVQYYKNQGKSLEQVLALDPGGDYDGRWSASSGLGKSASFISAVYKTLPAKGPVFFTMESATTVPGAGPTAGRRLF